MKIVKMLALTLAFGALTACGTYMGHSTGTAPSESGAGYYPNTGGGD